MAKYRVTVDTGGTFSDFVFFNEANGEITITKVPSTPKEPFQAVLNGVKELLDQGVAAGDVRVGRVHTDHDRGQCPRLSRARLPWSRARSLARVCTGSMFRADVGLDRVYALRTSVLIRQCGFPSLGARLPRPDGLIDCAR